MVMTAEIGGEPTTEAVSPCIRVCKFNVLGQCFGCFRTGEEVRNWKKFSSEERETATEEAAGRKADFWADAGA